MGKPWEKDEVVSKPWENDELVLQRENIGEKRLRSFQGGTVKGVAGLFGLPVDTVTNALNLAIAGYGTAVTAAGKPELAPNLIEKPYAGSERLVEKFKELGINVDDPAEWDTWSRALHLMGIVTGSSAVPANRSGIVKAFQPIETVSSAAATGAMSTQTNDPTLLGAAGFAGGISPSLASKGGQKAFALTKTGKETRENYGIFRRAGISPSVGQVTEVPFILAMEDILEKLPGGHKPFLELTKKQQEQLGKRFPPGSAEEAGRSIEKGVDTFKSRTRGVYGQMDTKLSQLIGSDSRVAPSTTLQILDELAGPVSGVERSSQTLSPERMLKFRAALQADMNNLSDIPVEGLRRLRTKVGYLMESAQTDISSSELKRLYGAMSDDLYTAAWKADGGTGDWRSQLVNGKKPVIGDATGTWQRQNQYWSARQDRINTALDRILGDGRKKMPEEVFSAAAPKNVEQVNLLRQVIRSLPEEEREVVRRAIVGRLGREAPGGQNYEGDVFTTKTFLKNWNKLSDGAKAQLMPDDAAMQKLDSVARTASKVEEASSTGKLFSGRFGSLGQVVYLAIVGSAYARGYAEAGHMAGAVEAGIAAAGASSATRMTANLLTDGDFVDWLSNVSKPVDPTKHMQRLAVIYNNSDEETKIDIEDFVDSLSVIMERAAESQPQTDSALPVMP